VSIAGRKEREQGSLDERHAKGVTRGPAFGLKDRPFGS
jgi:hypothetical protein